MSSEQPNKSMPLAVGRCIYCGTTIDLTKEHTVPFSLNGILVLQKASCKDCAKITSAFERSFTRDTLEVARHVMGYKTRRPARRRETYPAEVIIDGEVKLVDMPVDAYAALVPVIDLGFPTYLTEKYSLSGPEYRIGRRNNISITVSQDWGKTKGFLDSIGAERLRPKTSFHGYDFARMVAKIAYCETVAQLMLYGYKGLECIKENFILDFILRGDSEPWHYIGGEPPVAPPKDSEAPPDMRAVTIKDGDLIAYIQLFVQIGGPRYIVVVGRATEALREQLHSEGYEDA